MSFLANVIWFILGGLVLSICWALAGLLLCVTVIGIPLGVQCFKAARLSLAPFGKKVKIDFFEHPIANTVWALICGWEFAVFYLICGLVNCITVIGIPVGLQCFKFMKLALFPFGADIRK